MQIFSELLALYDGKPPLTGGFPSQRPFARSCDVFFDVRKKKTVQQTIEPLVIWDATALIVTSV